MVKVAVAAQMGTGAEPGKVIAGLNSTLCHQAQDQYATAVYVVLDQARRTGLLFRRRASAINSLAPGGPKHCSS